MTESCPWATSAARSGVDSPCNKTQQLNHEHRTARPSRRPAHRAAHRVDDADRRRAHGRRGRRAARQRHAAPREPRHRSVAACRGAEHHRDAGPRGRCEQLPAVHRPRPPAPGRDATGAAQPPAAAHYDLAAVLHCRGQASAASSTCRATDRSPGGGGDNQTDVSGWSSCRAAGRRAWLRRAGKPARRDGASIGRASRPRSANARAPS